MSIPKDLVAASATPMILAILAEGESYGYAITRRVRELSGGRMEWTDGMLYPVLHRLERQGLIKSFMRQSETGRKRRYYRIQSRGKNALNTQRGQWMLVHSVLNQLWENKPCLT
jgi:DNA-binding PadR family transcriptional regulator